MGTCIKEVLTQDPPELVLVSLCTSNVLLLVLKVKCMLYKVVEDKQNNVKIPETRQKAFSSLKIKCFCL